MPLLNDEEEDPSTNNNTEQNPRRAECSRNSARLLAPVDPEPHMSSQFYTFNRASHRLMVRCLMASRHPTPDEIRNVATAQVLASWRGVWKDRHEDTAYLTGWKRIQDKLLAQVDDVGNEVLFFKNNPYQFVPFIEQWGGIVQQFHVGPDLKHLGLKETLERMREVWTVGAKLYGVPESYVKVCISTCPACGLGSASDLGSVHQQESLENKQQQPPQQGKLHSGNMVEATAAATTAQQQQHQQQQSRRKRFEYTESFEVSARDVPQRLQLLADKYKVVLCIRQKYIRYKPFLAEVKDYCCHRGGEPTGRKPGVLKRKRYLSKRCGCSFRIRAIVPITNYDEKEKTFSYLEDGVATFKLYAVHSGHEPGPHEGSARIIHRFVDPGSVSGEEALREGVLRGVRELQLQLGALEERLGGISLEALSGVCREVSASLGRLRKISERGVSSGNPASSSRVAEGSCSGEMSREQAAPVPPPKRACARCCSSSREVLQGGSGLCRSCESLLRSNNASCSEEGSLELAGYCTENDKWYEGVACGLDAAGHGVELGFGHAIS